MTLTDAASSDINTSEEDLRPENGRLRHEHRGRYAEYERQKAEYEKWLKDEDAIQNKRDQWKAASARYYQRHPEVKEKKRLKAAERRAAKKLARRKWDPPKKNACTVVVVDDHTERRIGSERLPLPPDPRPSRVALTREGQQLGNFSDFPDINLSPDERDGYISQIFDPFNSWDDDQAGPGEAGWSRGLNYKFYTSSRPAVPCPSPQAANDAAAAGLPQAKESNIVPPARPAPDPPLQSPTEAADGYTEAHGYTDLARCLGIASPGIHKQVGAADGAWTELMKPNHLSGDEDC
ncbi:hypothetical protein B0H12DRAFT_1079448 [Mycena haematopus]|nr:hypothetical protein B0H12DRAFT_1079448 [Mycena haematopus]